MTNPSWSDYGTYDECAHPDLWNGVVGYWAPCLGPTGLRLHDLSRGANWGTLENMDAATDWVVSNGQCALDFDGSNDHINCGTGASLANFATTAGNPGTTFSFWVRPNAITGSGTILARNDGNSIQAGWWISHVNATIRVVLERSATNAVFVSSSLGLIAATWSHVVVTFRPNMAGTTSAGDVGIWFNGVAASVTQSVLGNGTQAFDSDLAETFYIARYGRTSGGGNGFFAGQLDDIIVHRRILTPNEIRRLYELGRGGMLERRRRRRRRAYVQQAGFRAHYATQRTQLIGGGLR